MPDALIFDLDGTLWDTNAVCADTWNDVVARLGIPWRPILAEDIRRVAGQPGIDAVRSIFAGLPEEQISHIAEEVLVADVRAIAAVGGDLYNGVCESIPLLRDRLPLMIVSNCQSGYIEVFLNTSGLAGHFVDFECWGNTGRSKAENLAMVIARNGLTEPWFVGDTEGDREAARANSVPFVHVSWGFGSAVDYDHRVDRFADLFTLLR